MRFLCFYHMMLWILNMAEVSNAERKIRKSNPCERKAQQLFFMVAQKRQTKCKSYNMNTKAPQLIVCLFMMRQAYVPRVETQVSHLHPVLPNICHNHPNASTNKGLDLMT